MDLLMSAVKSRGTWIMREQDYSFDVVARCSTCQEERIFRGAGRNPDRVQDTVLRCHCDEQEEAAQRVPGGALEKGALRVTLRSGNRTQYEVMTRQDAVKCLGGLHGNDRAWWQVTDTLDIAKADVLMAEWYPLPGETGST